MRPEAGDPTLGISGSGGIEASLLMQVNGGLIIQ
jgi:hypothetical protein